MGAHKLVAGHQQEEWMTMNMNYPWHECALKRRHFHTS